jgi:hypothetical protein
VNLVDPSYFLDAPDKFAKFISDRHQRVRAGGPRNAAGNLSCPLERIQGVADELACFISRAHLVRRVLELNQSYGNVVDRRVPGVAGLVCCGVRKHHRWIVSVFLTPLQWAVTRSSSRSTANTSKYM